MAQEKIMVFVDGNNLMRSAAQCNPSVRIDYIKFKEFIKEERDLKRIYFFDALPDRNDAQSYRKKTKFLDMLRQQGYTVKTKPLKYRPTRNEQGELLYNQPHQKGVDVALVCELIKMAKENAFDVAILVSGDNDFASAIELVQDMGKNVEVAAFKTATGYDLKQVANKLIPLEKYTDEFSLQEKNRKV